MGIISTTLVVLGVATIVGVSGAIINYATEDERAREKIKQLEAENDQLNSAKSYVDGIKNKLITAKEYLTDAKSDFKNGGHVLDEVPLANSEFTSCINKLSSAITNATNLIDDFNATISQNNKDIRTEKAKLD